MGTGSLAPTLLTHLYLQVFVSLVPTNLEFGLSYTYKGGVGWGGMITCRSGGRQTWGYIEMRHTFPTVSEKNRTWFHLHIAFSFYTLYLLTAPLSWGPWSMRSMCNPGSPISDLLKMSQWYGGTANHSNGRGHNWDRVRGHNWVRIRGYNRGTSLFSLLSGWEWDFWTINYCDWIPWLHPPVGPKEVIILEQAMSG